MLEDAIIISETELSNAKAGIARGLHKIGKTQAEISKMLNITQPMVSKYLSEKNPAQEDRKTTEKIIAMIKKNKSISFSCIATPKPIPANQEYFIATAEHIQSNEKSGIINALVEAAESLREKNLSGLLPEVKVNIAFCTKDAKSKSDVASFPSGLVFSKNYLKTYLEPEFGTSRHLSEILLYVRKINPGMQCVMNIKYSNVVLEKIKKAKFAYAFFNEDYKLDKSAKNFDILAHKGGFGIEPTTYIFGKSAKEVIEKLEKFG
jgi:predicted fused transcriptional regulator/phosphomethylpyrimidine kinase